MLKSHGKRRLLLLAVLTGHLFFPVWLVALLATTGGQDSSTWLVLLFATAAYVAYISLAGAWSWFGIYMQRAMPLLIVAAAFITRPRFALVTDSPLAAEIRIVALALGIYFLFKTVMAILGRRAKADALNLTFPVKGGKFIVGQGGSTKTVNHHKNHRSQKYAIDILKLGKFGMRADGLYPIAPQKYAIFGADVLSPCDGTVLAAVEDLPDQIPGERDTSNAAGNHVSIETNGAVIHLAHLMKSSVTVNPGQRVRAGQVLGRVGNSGNTSEPHLHVHAERDGRGVPIRFNGRFLVRNDVLEVS